MKVTVKEKQKRPTLYEIADELIDLHQELVEAGGELTEELEQRLESLPMEFAAKVENILYVISDMEMMAEAAKQEKKRLNDNIQRPRVNAIQRLKDYVQDQMDRLGCDRLDTKTHRVTMAKSPPKVDVTGEVPEELMKVETVKKLDKKLALSLIDSSDEGLPEEPGVYTYPELGVTVTIGRHLRIA